MNVYDGSEPICCICKAHSVPVEEVVFVDDRLDIMSAAESKGITA